MQTVKLGTLGTFQSGGTPKKSEPRFFGGKIPWISTTALDGAPIGAEAAATFLTDDALRHSAAKLVPAGSLLVGIRIGIGKNAVNRVPMATSQDIVAITGIDTDRWSLPYLMLFLEAARPRLQSLARGATIQGIQTGDVKNLDVPDLPLAEQQRIVRELQQVGALLANRRQVDEQLAELPKARFVEMFGDPVVNPRGWEVVPFTTCATIDTNMVQDFTGYEDFPHIGIDSIEKNTGKILAYRTIREDRVISGKYLFTPKHIIYSKIRPNLNKVALPTFDGLCSADAYPILPNAENCNRIYLAYMLRSKRFLNYILAFSSRTNMPKVNRKQVEGFRLPLPPLPAQRRFAAFARACAAQRAACARQIAVLETLRGKLLQDAFGAAG